MKINIITSSKEYFTLSDIIRMVIEADKRRRRGLDAKKDHAQSIEKRRRRDRKLWRLKGI